MAIGITYKSSVYSTTGATSYTCAPTWTPAANSLLVAFVVTCLGATPLDPTSVTGHGITYSKLTLSARTLGTLQAVSVWVGKAGASPSSVACVASYGAVSQTGGAIIEFEVTGADVSGTALQAIVQNPTNTGTATGGSVTLAAAGYSENRPMSFWLHLANNENTVPKASPAWTETSGADGGFNNPVTSAEAQFITSQFDTAPTASWATSSLWRGVAIEIKAPFADYPLNAVSGSYAVTPSNPTALADRLIAALLGNYTITGADLTFVRGYVLNAASDNYAISGSNLTTLSERLLNAVGGSYICNGSDANLLVDRLLSLNSGGYIISESAVSLLVGRLLNAETGNYALTGPVASLLANRILSADPEAYVIASFDTALSRGFFLNAGSGVYDLTGLDATLVYVVAEGLSLNAEPGTYTFTGADIDLLCDRVLSATSGFYIITGPDATLVADKILAASPGTYSLTAPEVSILAQRLLATDYGEYQLTGSDVSFLKGLQMLADSGSYIIIGSSAKALLEVDMIIGGLTTEEHNKVMSIPDIQLTAYIKNKKYLEKVGNTWYLVIKDDNNVYDILRKALKDKDGQDVKDFAAGALAQELKSSV